MESFESKSSPLNSFNNTDHENVSVFPLSPWVKRTEVKFYS